MGVHVPCISRDIVDLMWSASKAEEKLRCWTWFVKRSVRTMPQAKGLMISLSNCKGHTGIQDTHPGKERQIQDGPCVVVSPEQDPSYGPK